MKRIIWIWLALAGAGPVCAQEHQHEMSDTAKHPMPMEEHGKMGKKEHMDHMKMGGMENMQEMGMTHAFSLNLPMTRDGSGTGWVPDASPMYGYMVHSNGWMFMFHGDIFPRYNKQDIFNKGYRRGEKWDAPDMLMAMGQRKLGKSGLFHFNIMLSTDAIIAGGSGYPLLFQTGESWKGQPLVDRQHPHDLFSELSVSYTQALSRKADIFFYVGYPGEPALGPVTFMHRPSGEFLPDAPIGHHWEDATHITFGVATLGLRYGQFKLEGSSFTGGNPMKTGTISTSRALIHGAPGCHSIRAPTGPCSFPMGSSKARRNCGRTKMFTGRPLLLHLCSPGERATIWPQQGYGG